MLFNYFKGTSAAILSSVFTFLLLDALFDPNLNFKDGFIEFYSYLMGATFVGLIFGLAAIWILWLHQGEDIFSRDILAVFAAAGILIGILLDLFFGFAVFPSFLISSLIGSLLFLGVQKIKNKIIGWMVVALLFAMIFVYPQVSNYFRLLNL